MSWLFKTLVLGLVPILAGVSMITLDMAFEKKDLWAERESGLRWLFTWRGSRQAPSDVVGRQPILTPLLPWDSPRKLGNGPGHFMGSSFGNWLSKAQP